MLDIELETTKSIMQSLKYDCSRSAVVDMCLYDASGQKGRGARRLAIAAVLWILVSMRERRNRV